MKTLIKIDRRTIKPNKQYVPAGHIMLLEGKRTITIESKHELPKNIEKYFLLSTWDQLPKNKKENCIYYGDGDIKPILRELQKYNINNPGEVNITITHTPIEVQSIGKERYKYKYKNKKVKCNECHSLIKLKDIGIGFIVTDDDEYNADKCPVCKALGSFDYKLENINDIKE